MKSVDIITEISATPLPAITDDAVLTSRVRMTGWCVLTVAGLVETLFYRHAMQADGISYLDMGDALVRGDWKMAINGIWSPLYPCLQGLAHRLFKPSPYWQFTVVHGVNFLIFLFALGCFDFLLRVATADHSSREDSADGAGPLPRWAVLAVGYSAFLWSSLSLITMERVTPDLLMAGFLCAAVGLLLQIWERPERFSKFVLLGVALGLGYLAKAPVFPLSLLFFTFAWILVSNWRKAVPRVLTSVIVFLAIAGPWVVALSRAKGRFTFGDSARYNYVLWVNHASPSWYSQNLGDAGGHYVHTVRKIFESPPIYEFATPLKGTIPVWYDPSYWAEGAVPRFTLKEQFLTIRRWLEVCLDMVFTSQASLLVGFIVLFFMAGRDRFSRQISARWPVWLIGLAGLGMYMMVQVAPRYVAVFFALFWVGLYSGLMMPPGRNGRRLVSAVTLAVVFAMASPVVAGAAGHFRQELTGEVKNNHWQVAEELRRLGVKPGDRVARIGGRYDVGWARLLGVTVVAEVPRGHAWEFWCGTPQLQAQVIETFRRLGVTAIVAEHFPPEAIYTPGPEWQKLLDGTYHALILAPNNVR